MKTSLVILFIFLLNIDFAQAQNFSWAGVIEKPDPTPNYITDIAVDKTGSTIAFGDFLDLTDFDIGAGTHFLNPVPNKRHFFVAKYDFFGGLQYVKTLTPSLGAHALEMELDTSDNLYFTGSFNGICDMNPGPGVFNVTGPSLVICKLDEFGNFIWAKTIGDCHITGMSVDLSNNIVLSASYWTDSLNISTGLNPIYIHPQGNKEVVIKLDSLGNTIWAKQFQHSNASYDIQDLDTDNNGNIYVTGTFDIDSIDFDPGPNSYFLKPNIRDGYIVSLDGNGNFRWAKKNGGNGQSSGDILQTKDNNVYMSGIFTDELILDSGGTNTTFIQHPYYQNFSSYVAKYSSTGTLDWARAIFANSSVNSHIRPLGLALNENSDLFSTGTLQGVADFNPDSSQYLLTSDTSLNRLSTFVYSLDSLGSFNWAFVNKSAINGLNIDAGPLNSIFISGFTYYSGDFDPGPDTFMVNIPPNTSIPYLIKIGDSIEWPDLPMLRASQDTTCSRDSVLIMIDSGRLNDCNKWVWYADGCGTVKLGEGDSIVVSRNKSGLIYARGESSIINAGPCSNKLITVNPEFSLGNDTFLCRNQGQSIIIDPGNSYTSYLWSDGSTDQTLLVDEVYNIVNGDIISVEVTDNNACRNSDTVAIGFSICGALSGTGTELINTIYPNPTSDRLIIELSKAEKVRLTIYDTKGVLMLEKRSEAKEIQLYLRDLPAAKYILKIQGDDIDVQTGIIKN